jgi:guanine deaminase
VTRSPNIAGRASRSVPRTNSRTGSDASYLRAAIRLSHASVRAGGGPFGAVIVRRGKIIARGRNRVTMNNDPTAHAEILAIREACRRLMSFRLDDCVLFTSCEPCPMCLAAIYWARIRRVVFGNTRDDAAQIGFDDDLLYRELARPLRARKLIMRQALRREARAAFRDWLSKPGRTSY